LFKALVVVVPYDWSGSYLGGNSGLSVGRDSTNTPIPALGSNEQFTLNPLGAIGGGQIGANWQATPHLVVGVEADLQWSGERTSACVFHCTAVADGGFLAMETISQRLGWLSTARGRVGVTNGPALFYATGGVAFSRINTDFSHFDPEGAAGALKPFAAAGSFSQTKSGWTVGAGLETRLFGNWTGRIEYLYVDLGTVTGSIVFSGGGVQGQADTFASRVQDHIFRIGVNYKLGGLKPAEY
jgi:outer membrane immunogenic protein